MKLGAGYGRTVKSHVDDELLAKKNLKRLDIDPTNEKDFLGSFSFAHHCIVVLLLLFRFIAGVHFWDREYLNRTDQKLACMPDYVSRAGSIVEHTKQYTQMWFRRDWAIAHEYSLASILL